MELSLTIPANEMIQCLTWCRYGIVLLVVECMGATTVLIYGLHLLYDPVMEDLPEDPNCPGKPLVRPVRPACTYQALPYVAHLMLEYTHCLTAAAQGCVHAQTTSVSRT